VNRENLRKTIRDFLKDFNCHYTIDLDTENGFPLVDILSPKGTIREGLLEIEHISDELADEVFNSLPKMNHEWKERPKGFLADFTPQHDEERKNYVRELHQVIWKLLKVIGISWSGELKNCVTTTLDSLKLEGEELSQEKIAGIYAKKKYDYASSPDTLAGHVYQRGWLDCFEHYQPKTQEHSQLLEISKLNFYMLKRIGGFSDELPTPPEGDNEKTRDT